MPFHANYHVSKVKNVHVRVVLIELPFHYNNTKNQANKIE